MSNNTVDMDDELEEAVETPEETEKDQTLAAFRIRADAIPFFKRMIQFFYETHLINEPKLSLLAKACTNIMAHKYAKQEEVNLANYIQKNVARVRGPNTVSLTQMQKEIVAQGWQPPKKQVKDLIPQRLKKDPPLDPGNEPEWAKGW